MKKIHKNLNVLGKSMIILLIAVLVALFLIFALSWLLSGLLLLILLFVYFLPSLIAWNKPSLKYIFLFNLLAGWTGFGWFIAVMWSIEKDSN